MIKKAIPGIPVGSVKFDFHPAFDFKTGDDVFNEPATVEQMHRYMEEQGYTLDITDQRLHHEIYLSDVRKVAPEKLKTVIRHPIRPGS